jgi:hypothetical protein|tara:strand:- start:553 stop:1752 length:1200 start_codon:yes stop_codon:yes gene_type:complete
MATTEAGDVTTTISRESPEVEAYKLGNMESAFKLVQDRAGLLPPAYKMAGLSGMQVGAGNVLSGGLGAYQPYLQNASGSTQGGINAISGSAMPMMQQGYGAMQSGLGALGQAQQLAAMTRGTPYQFRDQGIAGLEGATGRFDPSSISDFYDPYAEQVIAAQQQDVARLGGQQQDQARAQAAAAGAFGGSRAAIQETEIGRNTLGEQSRIGAQLRSQGYQQARQAAQQAFEQQQNRRMAAGQGIGQLGLQYGQLAQGDVQQLGSLGQARGALGQGIGSLGAQTGNLGSRLGALGMQQAQLGALGQQMNLNDVNAMMQLGGVYQQNQQAQLDAQRMSEQQAFQMPYQQLGFLSDIYKGAPSSQYSILSSPSAPSVSPFQQIAGLGIAGLGAASGAKYAGLF